MFLDTSEVGSLIVCNVKSPLPLKSSPNLEADFGYTSILQCCIDRARAETAEYKCKKYSFIRRFRVYVRIRRTQGLLHQMDSSPQDHHIETGVIQIAYYR